VEIVLSLIKSLSLCSLLISTPLWATADIYVNGFGGWASHGQDSMLDSNTRPTGLVYGAGFGQRYNYYEFELNASSGKLTSDIEHDGAKNTIQHEQFQATLALNFYLLRSLYVRLGYALTSVEQSTKTPVSGASGEGLQKEYKLEDKKTDGVVIGGGWVWSELGKMNLYLQYDYYMLPDIKATQHQASAGFRWYIK